MLLSGIFYLASLELQQSLLMMNRFTSAVDRVCDHAPKATIKAKKDWHQSHKAPQN